MKYLSLLFCIFLVACGGHEKAGSGETTRTISANNWPKDLSVKEDEMFSYDPKVQSNLEGSISYTSENLPSWAQLNSKTGVITGTPTNDDSGRKYSKIKLLVNNGNSKALEIGPFSIDVVAVNDAPEISAQSIQANKTDVAYEGELAYVDIDNTVNQLTFEITKQPEHADVEMVLGTSKFRVFPKSFEVFTSQQSFDVKVKDGSEETDSVTIDFSLMDESEFNFHINIPDNSSIVDLKQIMLNSSHPVRLEDLTFNTEKGSCVGSFQVSSDNFSTCVEIKIERQKDSLTGFIVNLNLEPSKTYKVFVRPEVHNIFGNKQNENLQTKFHSIGELIITEISGSPAFRKSKTGEYLEENYFQRWIEIYNPSSKSINLKNYAIYANSITNYEALTSAEVFELPDQIMHPGEYILLRATNFGQNTNSSNVIYLRTGNQAPFWDHTGFIELLKADGEEIKSVDYMAFGSGLSRFDEEFEPYGNDAWVGDNLPAMQTLAGSEGMKSYQRGKAILDTNSAADWEISNVATPGGANDVLCSYDHDQDGIPDCSEVEGSTFAGVDLYSLGARPGQRDIFVEIDYMDSSITGDVGLTPNKTALKKIQAAFMKQGIHVHFDVGGLFGDAIGQGFNLGGGNQIPFSSCLEMGASDECADLYEIKNANMDINRLYSFHYAVFGNTNKAKNIWGQAELGGNDLMVVMGEYDFIAESNELANQQALTLMHELGHNLGLHHGGNSPLNNKPNYLSIMNYMYSHHGLPSIGNSEGDRYYLAEVNAKHLKGQQPSCTDQNASGLLHGATSENVNLDFSHGTSISIFEGAINELDGLGQVNSSSVDFDCDGTNGEPSVSVDVNFDGLKRTLIDYDDWSSLQLAFQKTFLGTQNLILGETNDGWSYGLGNDKGSIVEEPPLPYYILEKRLTRSSNTLDLQSQ